MYLYIWKGVGGGGCPPKLLWQVKPASAAAAVEPFNAPAAWLTNVLSDGVPTGGEEGYQSG